MNIYTPLDDYSIIGQNKSLSFSYWISAACLSLTGCGGDSTETTSIPVTLTQSPSPVINAPVNQNNPYKFTKIVSSPLQGAKVSLSFEAIAVSDITGDGYVDIIMSNGGNGISPGWIVNKTPISESDNRTTILINSGNNQFTQLNTDHIKPTGWVNDWLVVPQPNKATPYIIGIDHGREVGDISNFDQWVSKLQVYQYENGNLIELTDSIKSNTPSYYHNSSSYGDLNNDGYQDFVTAEMSKISVFFGDPKEVFTEVTDSVFAKEMSILSYGSDKYIGNTSVALIIDVGNDGQDDIVTLPYMVNTSNSNKIDYYNGDILKFVDGKYSQRYTFAAKSKDVPTNYGYAVAKVIDVNNDGLQDIVALMEVGSGSHLKIVSVMIQQKDETFSVHHLQTNNSLFVGPTADNFMLSPKFEVVDIDGDKNLDLYIPLMTGSSSHKAAGLFFGDGSGNFTQDSIKAEKVFADITWEGSARTFISDFNNDGLGDFLVLQEGFAQGSAVITPIVFLNHTPFG